jgi:hypothetical protein
MFTPFPAEMWGQGSLGIQEDGEFSRHRFRLFIKIHSFSVIMTVPWFFLGFFKIFSFTSSLPRFLDSLQVSGNLESELSNFQEFIEKWKETSKILKV